MEAYTREACLLDALGRGLDSRAEVTGKVFELGILSPLLFLTVHPLIYTRSGESLSTNAWHTSVCIHIFCAGCCGGGGGVEATPVTSSLICSGIQTLTNQKQGHYYGEVAYWPPTRRRRLGVYLLHRALQVFLAEGERELRPQDIQARG